MSDLTNNHHNPMEALLVEEGERPHWEADLIILKDLWRQLVRTLLDTFNQRDKHRPWNLCVWGNTLTGKTTFFNYFIPALRSLPIKI
jgi:hypothetical protein